MTAIEAWATHVRAAIDQAAQETGLRPAVVATQWGEECGWSVWGCNQGHPGQDGINNFGGIMAGDTVANFASVAAFVAEYVRTINSYKAALGPIPADPAGQCQWLGRSPYNGAGHYAANGEPGGRLLAIWADFGAELTAALAPSPTTPPPGAPAALDLTITVAGYGTGHLVFPPRR